MGLIRRALKPGGRFAFETRNPGARAWERWAPEHGVDWATLRFTGADEVDGLLRETGFEVVERCGSWDRAPLTGAGREIITIARPGRPPAGRGR